MMDKAILAEKQLLELLELPEEEEEKIREYLAEHGMRRLFYEYLRLPLSRETKLKIGTIAQLLDCDGRESWWRP